MINIIAAISKNNAIGKGNKIPWHIPEDFKHFKELTMGHAVIMGRKTFESILESLGKPLPGRKNIIVTRQADYKVPNEVEIFISFNAALAAHSDEDIFVIGGAEIYKQAIDRADKLYITRVDQVVDGDAYFPEIPSDKWQLINEEKKEGYSFCIYQRKANL